MSQKETYESQTETLLICGESNSSSNPICPKMDPAMIQRSLWADWCQFVHRDDPYLSECAEVWNQEKWWQVGTAVFLSCSEIPSHSDGRSPVHHVVSFNCCMMSLQGRCKDECTASNCPIVSCIGPVLILFFHWPFAFSVARFHVVPHDMKVWIETSKPCSVILDSSIRAPNLYKTLMYVVQARPCLSLLVCWSETMRSSWQWRW